MGRGKTFLLSLAAAAALIGAAGGAGVYALLSPKGSTTIVRQVTVGRTQPTSASTVPLSVASIYQLAYRGVVKVIVTTTASGLPFGGGDQSSQAQGSGFVFDSAGHVITNEHVVAGGGTIKIQFWDGTSYGAKVVGVDKSTDVAVLKVSAPSSKLHPLSFADSSKVAVGDGVVAIGAPFGLQETVTSGIVSALHRQMTAPNNFTIDDSIQTDAAINHGNSGGPLLNTQGQVIGITSQIESDSGGSDGVGFAVPSDTVKSIAAKLVATGKVEHAYLGVSLNTTPAPKGVQLETIRIGTPADTAGLKSGDVVTAINGLHVGNADALRAAIDSKHPGDTITVTYIRGGSTHTAKVTLGNRPS